MAIVKLRREGDKEQGEAILLPKGKYRVKLMAQEQASGPGKDNPTTGKKARPWSGLRVTLKLVGGEHAGHEQDFMLFDGRDAQLSLFEAAGFEIDTEADEVEVNLDDLIGLDLNVFLDVNKNGTYNNVVRFEPAPRMKKASAVKSEPLPNEDEIEEEV